MPERAASGLGALYRAAIVRCRDLDERMSTALGNGRALSVQSIVAMLVILAMGGVLALNRLGAAELCEFNEVVEARVIQDMLERGNLLFPRVSGEEPSYKPPFLHWIATGLSVAMGVREASEMTARLPPALFALAGLAITMVFAHGRFGAHSAVLTGMILLGTWPYVRHARFGRVDMPLAILETATLLAFLVWAGRVDRDGRNGRTTDRWLWLAVATAGCGVLTKGPVGAMLPLGAIIVTVALAARRDLARRMLRPRPVALLLALGGGWYALCGVAGTGDLVDLQLGTENLGRFTGTLGSMPPWYYLEPLLFGAPPFTLLTPIAVAVALKRFLLTERLSGHARDLTTGFLAIFWLVTVLFFSIAAYKRRAYLLPIVPAGAILLSHWLAIQAATPNGRALRGAIAGACVVWMLANAIAVPLSETRRCPPGRFEALATHVRALVPGGTPLVSVGGTAGGDLTAMRFYLRRPLPPAPASGAPRGSYVLVFGATASWAELPSPAGASVPTLRAWPGKRAIGLFSIP